jgi:3-hydroxyisobutyrate dehydrogenase
MILVQNSQWLVSQEATRMRVTVLGTGIMGAGVAGSLLRAGHQVTVWNRNGEKTEPLVAAGASAAASPSAAVADAQAVLTVLFDADSVAEVATPALDALDPSAIWVQMTTVGLDGSAQLAQLAEEHGTAFVEAQMLGTKAPAEKGQLVLLLGGDQQLLDRLAPVFDAIAVRSVNTGSAIGPASALKLAANAWVLGVNALVGQSMALATSLGLDPQLFLDAIAGGAVDTPYAHMKGAAMQAGEYPPSFPITGVLKDLDLIRSAAVRAGVSEDVIGAVAAKYGAARRGGHGDDDMAAVYTAFLPTH